MASELLNLLVDCLICGKDKVDKNPRQLSCMHSFCEECLSKTSSIHIGDKLQCPICLQKTQSSIPGLPLDSKSKVIRRGINTVRDVNICRVCALKGEKIAAAARCSECEFCLCQTCADEHKGNSASSLHTVLEDVCKIHIRDLSHACLTCRIGLCFECVISGFHEGHDTCDLPEAYEKTVHMMTKAKQVLQVEKVDLDQKMNQTMMESMSFLKQRREETGIKLEQYWKEMVKSLRQFIDKRDEKYHKAVISALSEQNEATTQASNCINEVNILTQRGKREMLTKLVQQTSDVFKTLNAIREKKGMAISVPNLRDDKCKATGNTDGGTFEMSCALGDLVPCFELYKRKPRQRLCKTETDQNINNLCYIKAMKDGSAVLGLFNSFEGVKIDVMGEVKLRYSTKNGGRTRGIDMRGEDLYVGTQKGALVVRVSGLDEHAVLLDPPLQTSLTDLAIEGNNLILLDGKYLWRYSFDGKRKRAIKVDSAWRISVGIHPVIGTVYIVSDDKNYQLRVYRPDGQLLRTIGKRGKQDGEFLYVSGSSMLPNGNILVADANSHRVSEFGFDGGFIRHLLTEEDGLQKPYDISFEHPFLWIACWKKVVLFTFE